MKQPTIVTITGPSSSGKTVLSNDLHQHGFEPLVSTTTRAKRRGEIQDVHYHFVDEATFQQMEREQRLIESINYGGKNYGVSSAEVERAHALGRPAVLVVEPHGVEQISKYCAERDWQLVRVFVNNPPELLLARMLCRATENTLDIHIQDHPAVQAQIEAQSPTLMHELKDVADQVDIIKAYVAQTVEAARQALGKEGDPITADHPKVITDSERISKVLDFEVQAWVKPALDGRHHYDMIFPAFNDDNRQSVVDEVEKRARHLMSQAHELADLPAGGRRRSNRP